MIPVSPITKVLELDKSVNGNFIENAKSATRQTFRRASNRHNFSQLHWKQGMASHDLIAACLVATILLSYQGTLTNGEYFLASRFGNNTCSGQVLDIIGGV